MIRDIRVDTVGFINELVKHLKEPNVDAIKTALKAKRSTEAAGDVFAAKLVGGGGVTLIDPMKWFALWKAKTITRHQLFEGMRINVEFAEELLSGEDLARISSIVPSPKRLCFDRIGDVPPDIKQAVAALAIKVAERAEAA